MNLHCNALAWAQKNFSGVCLFNKKRESRLIQIASRLAEGKGTSLARLFDNWYDTKATYNLLRQRQMTPDTIQEVHRNLVYNDILNWSDDVLAIEDSSEFEWNGKAPIEGLGPIGSGRKQDQGFVLHTTMAIGVNTNENSMKVLGIPYQQFYVRPPVREKKKQRAYTTEPIETDLWRTIISKKALPADAKVIRVCDRNADIYEVIQETKEHGCRHIIRLRHDRIAIQEGCPVRLLMQNLEPMGQFTIAKRFKNQNKEETALLNVSWKQVELRAPSRPGLGIGKLAPLKETVVHVFGRTGNGELIEWFLYTDIEISSTVDAIRIVKYYAKRWTIEDYHKTLKTGLKAENLQLQEAHAIFAAISIMSVVATKLLDLRESLRINPEAPASESGLTKLELKVLGHYLKRELKTIKCVALAIGRLGGHQNRRGDGMPGILSLWWGMNRFLSIMEGVQFAIN